MKKRVVFIMFFVWLYIGLSSKTSYGQEKSPYLSESKGKYVNGKKEGLWKFYDVNGKLIGKGKYDKDLKQGLWNIYEKTFVTFKKPVLKVNYKDGKKEGKSTYYDVSKDLKKVLNRPSIIENWKNDLPHGAWLRYQEGKVWEEKNYKEGVLHGPLIEYEEGKVWKESNYKEGVLHGRYSHNMIFTNTKNKNTIDTYPYITGNYKDGLEHGLWTKQIGRFIEDKFVFQERTEYNFARGERDGEYKKYDLSKNPPALAETGQYKKGAGIGLWRRFNTKNKKVEQEIEFLDDKNTKDTQILIVRDNYYENGQPKREYQETRKLDITQKNGPYREFYKNGNIKEEGEYVKGEKSGKWTYLHENGKTFTEKTFVEGVVTDGQYKEYNKDGELEKETTYLFQQRILEKTYFNNTLKLYSFSEQGERIEEECCEIEKDWNGAKQENTILSFGKFKEKHSTSGLSKIAQKTTEEIIKNITPPKLEHNLLEKKDSIQREVYKLETDLKKMQEVYLTTINDLEPSFEEVFNYMLEKLGIDEEYFRTVLTAEKRLEIFQRERKKMEEYKKMLIDDKIVKEEEIAKRIERQKKRKKMKENLIVPVQKEIDSYIKSALETNKKYANYLRYFPNATFGYNVLLKQLDLEEDIKKAQGNPFGELSFSDDQTPLNNLKNEQHLITVVNFTKWLGLKTAQDIFVSYKGFTASSEFHQGSFQVKIDECESNILPAGRYTITVSSKVNKNIAEYRTEVMGLKGGNSTYPLGMFIGSKNTSNEETSKEEKRLPTTLIKKIEPCFDNSGWLPPTF